MHKFAERERDKRRRERNSYNGGSRRADGGFDGGSRGRGKNRRLEDVAGKDASSFVLADNDQR